MPKFRLAAGVEGTITMTVRLAGEVHVLEAVPGQVVVLGDDDPMLRFVRRDARFVPA